MRGSLRVPDDLPPSRTAESASPVAFARPAPLQRAREGPNSHFRTARSLLLSYYKQEAYRYGAVCMKYYIPKTVS